MGTLPLSPSPGEVSSFSPPHLHDGLRRALETIDAAHHGLKTWIQQASVFLRCSVIAKGNLTRISTSNRLELQKSIMISLRGMVPLVG